MGGPRERGRATEQPRWELVSESDTGQGLGGAAPPASQAEAAPQASLACPLCRRRSPLVVNNNVYVSQAVAVEPEGGTWAIGSGEPDSSEPASSPAPAGAEPSILPAAEAKPSAPSTAAKASGGSHCYAVWKAPGSTEDLVGVHRGGLVAWHAIAARLAGKRYFSGRDRLRKFPSLEAAVDGFLAERDAHGVSSVVRVFTW